MKTTTFASFVSAAIFALVQVDALPSYVPRLPNGANVQGVTALGHADHVGDSDELDAFGTAFKNAGRKWTVALCQADSDGDGQTNGQELGDPCCTWSVGGTPKFTSGVSNPGDASSKVSASVLSANSCATPAATTATPAVTPASSSSPTTTTAAPASTPAPGGSSSPAQQQATVAPSPSTNSTTAAHDNC